MKLNFQGLNEKDFLNPYYRKQKILEEEFTLFKENFENYGKNLEKNLNENEDALVANVLKPFFESLGFKSRVKLKQEGKSEIDLALFNDDHLEVLIEVKKPSNAKEMLNPENFNCKALHESILYYLRERDKSNTSLKFIIITDLYQFYIFEAKEFEQHFYSKDSAFKKLYEDFKKENSLFKGNTDEFYQEAQKLLESYKDKSLKALFLNLKEALAQKDTSFSTLKPFFQVFSPDFLLAKFSPNDANTLNEGFYRELLYILGLDEKETGGGQDPHRCKSRKLRKQRHVLL